MILSLIARNLKVFFRDKQTIFFSLLGVLIVILLYILFLAKSIREPLTDLPNVDLLVDTYIMSGVLSVGTLTTTLAAYAILIDDYVTHRQKDLYASPIKHYQINLAYLITSIIIGYAITLLTFTFSIAYFAIKDNTFLDLTTIINASLILLLMTINTVTFSSLTVTFIKTHAAYSAVNVLLGTLIGFVTGVYIPMGALSDSMQTLVKICPISHGAALLRKIIMKIPLKNSFQNTDPQIIKAYEKYLGITFYNGNTEITNIQHIIFLLATTIAFLNMCQATSHASEK